MGFLILCMEFFSQEIEKSGKCERKFGTDGERDYVSEFPLATIKIWRMDLYGSRFVETQSGGL